MILQYLQNREIALPTQHLMTNVFHLSLLFLYCLLVKEYSIIPVIMLVMQFLPFRCQNSVLYNNMSIVWWSNGPIYILMYPQNGHIGSYTDLYKVAYWGTACWDLACWELAKCRTAELYVLETIAHYGNKFTKTFRPAGILHIFTKFQFGVFHQDFFL